MHVAEVVEAVTEQPVLVTSDIVEQAVASLPLQVTATSVTAVVKHSCVVDALAVAVAVATWVESDTRQPRTSPQVGESTCDETVCSAPLTVDII